jgi:hypothetical protein
MNKNNFVRSEDTKNDPNLELAQQESRSGGFPASGTNEDDFLLTRVTAGELPFEKKGGLSTAY